VVLGQQRPAVTYFLTYLLTGVFVLAGDTTAHSLASSPVGDVTKSAPDSAFSLPPARVQSDHRQLPFPVARSRDEERPSKPRIWSLAEVATSSDRRPLKNVRSAVVSGEFRPWTETETATRESPDATLEAWRTLAARWRQNDVESGVTITTNLTD